MLKINAFSLMITACLLAGSSVSLAAGHEIRHAGDTASGVGAHTTFTGSVRHDSVSRPDENSHYSISYVTFEPGARTFWHTHPAGQRLLVISGKGLVGTADDKVDVVRVGDNVWCPPDVKHWHGATPDTAMVHMAITNVKDGKNVDWMEELKDIDYQRLTTEALKRR